MRPYRRIFSPETNGADGSGYVHEHRVIAEQALGKQLPPKAVVHHHTPYELVICEDQAYHLLLHQRMKAFTECGNASHKKCWYCGEWDSVNNLYISPNKKQVVHRKCRKEYKAKIKGE